MFRIPVITLQGKNYVIVKGHDVVMAVIELQKNFPWVKIDKNYPIVHLPFCNLINSENGSFDCGSFGKCVLEGGDDYPVSDCPMKGMHPINSLLFTRYLPKKYIFVPIYVELECYICAEEYGYKNLINRGSCKHCRKQIYMDQFPSDTTEGWLCPHCKKPVTLHDFGYARVEGSKGIFIKTH